MSFLINFFHVCQRDAHQLKRRNCANIIGFSKNLVFGPTLFSNAAVLHITLSYFNFQNIMTHFTVLSVAAAPKLTCFPPTNNFFFSSPYAPLNSLLTQHNRSSPGTPHPATSQEKPSADLFLLRFSFSSFSNRFLDPYFFSTVTSISFNPLASLIPRRAKKHPNFYFLSSPLADQSSFALHN